MRRNRNNRPSLIGTAARTAVVVGTASAVSGAVAGSQAQRAAAQQANAQQAAAQQAAAQQPDLATAGLTEEKFTQLQRAAELHKSGILTDAEFDQMKANILAS